jgi:hypothetical protein
MKNVFRKDMLLRYLCLLPQSQHKDPILNISFVPMLGMATGSMMERTEVLTSSAQVPAPAVTSWFLY